MRQKEFEHGFLQGDNSTREDQLKQKHTAEMWTSLTEGQEDHYELKSEVAIRDCREWPHNYFAKIARSQAQKRFINKEDNLKVNPCRKRKPMELFCHESRYMRELRNAGNQTSSRIKERLKWRQAGFWLANEGGVTIINPGTDKGMDHRLKYRHGNRAWD